jgi:hypothetical protein
MRHRRLVQDEAAHHPSDPAGIELGVIKIVRAVQADTLWAADTAHDVDTVAGCIQFVDRVVPDGVDEKMTVFTNQHVVRCL